MSFFSFFLLDCIIIIGHAIIDAASRRTQLQGQRQNYNYYTRGSLGTVPGTGESQAPRFNATEVAWPLSCCGIATSVSFAMHLLNPLGVRSYRESRAVL